MKTPHWVIPTLYLGILFVIGHVGWAIAAAFSQPLPTGFVCLYSVGVPWALAWWVQSDCREHRIPVSIDHGWFVFIAWPVTVPYHLFRTRGLRGGLVLAGLLGLFVATWVFALVLYLLLR